MKYSKKPIYVIGHKNPDTDAICAAIGQAEYMRQIGKEEALAVRCGDIPERVNWVLEQAEVATPELIEDVRCQAKHISHKNFVAVYEDDTFLSVYLAMRQSDLKSIPVLNHEGEVSGILHFTELMKLLMPSFTEMGFSVKTVYTSTSKIIETLDGKSEGAALSEKEDKEEELWLFVGASSEHTVVESLQKTRKEDIAERQIVICGDRENMQNAAIEEGVRILIVTGGFEISPQLVEKAKQKGVVVCLSKFDTATTVQLVRCSRRVESALGKDFISINASEAVSDIIPPLGATEQDLFPVVRDGTKKIVGVFRKSDLVDPPRTRVVLVDHNEYAQAVRGIKEAQILEVIDHHRLGGDICSREPIYFLNEPVGSSSTLVARKFKNEGVTLEKGVAMCLCAGLISDTLNLTSPTTTELDKEILQWLCKIAEIKAAKFTSDFFAAGSLLRKGSVKEMIRTDRKDFTEKDMHITISQVEEMDLDKFEERLEEMTTGLQSFIDARNYDIGLLVVTDISKHHSKIIALGRKEIVEGLPYKKITENVYDAAGVVSRKKQILPSVCDAINRARAHVLNG